APDAASQRRAVAPRPGEHRDASTQRLPRVDGSVALSIRDSESRRRGQRQLGRVLLPDWGRADVPGGGCCSFGWHRAALRGTVGREALVPAARTMTMDPALWGGGAR